MGTYRFDEERNAKKKEMPAGWRGIGCLLILILPPFSFLGAKVLLGIGAIRIYFYRMSPKLFGAPSIPPVLDNLKGIAPYLRSIRSWTDLEVTLLFAVVILIILSGFISVLYGFMYRAVRPSKYGPMDAPPPKRSRKSRKKYSR